MSDKTDFSSYDYQEIPLIDFTQNFIQHSHQINSECRMGNINEDLRNR
jgi:hypothetical protein